MVKRVFCLLMTLCLLSSVMVGCGASSPEKTEATTQPSESVEQTESMPQETESTTEETQEQLPPETTEEEIDPSTEPATQPATEATRGEETFSMDRASVVLVSYGERFDLYSGSIDPSLVTWTTDNASVATIELGIVTAVSKGETTVYGEYNGTRSSCKVVCNLSDEQPTEPTQPTESQPTNTGAGPRDPVMAPPSTQVVDASFFDDAAFVGDSISLMLSNYCDKTAALGNATFLVRGSYGVGNEVVANYHIIYKGAETLLEDALADCGAQKVFIMLGMNDIGLYGVDGTMENWGKLLTRLRAKLPNIQIYIQSMTPIWTGGEIGGLNNTNVEKYNQKLQAFAAANGCKYIDVASYMKDSTGGLASRYCSDNYVHLTEAGAQAWIKILMAYTGY